MKTIKIILSALLLQLVIYFLIFVFIFFASFLFSFLVNDLYVIEKSLTLFLSMFKGKVGNVELIRVHIAFLFFLYFFVRSVKEFNIFSK